MFNIVLLEGLFYLSGTGHLVCLRDDGDKVVVVDLLESLRGEQVQFALHHVPSLPVDSTKWGAGCCKYQPAECPVGHHKDPAYLLNVHGSGTLQARGTHQNGDLKDWYLSMFDGSHLDLPLEGLIGHTSRIAAVPLVDVENMRDALGAEGLGAVMSQARDLQGVLSQMQAHTKKEG